MKKARLLESPEDVKEFLRPMVEKNLITLEPLALTPAGEALRELRGKEFDLFATALPK